MSLEQDDMITAASCGTARGFRRHLRDRTTPCNLCVEADVERRELQAARTAAMRRVAREHREQYLDYLEEELERRQAKRAGR
jgi:hypothetical protein